MKKLNLIKLLKIEQLERQLIYCLVLMIFLISNLLISNISLRVDFSYGKAYTLSSSTRNILRKLDDLVNIKFFVSSDLPTRFLPLKNEVIDFLTEYKKIGRGKIVLKVLDPKKDQQAANQAKELGIPELQFSQLEKDKYALSTSYFGIALIYADKQEILPQVTDLGSLEYNLTAAIYKLTRKELIKIGILGRSERFNPQEDELSTFKKVANQQFTLDYLDVSSKSATADIDRSYKAILVFDDNKKEYDQQEIAALDRYLNQNGKAIFFVDGIWVGDNLEVRQARHNLFNFLSDWGIDLNKDFILSTSAELVNFSNELVQFFTPYPFWIKTANFNLKTSYFSNVQQLTFPWTASINLKKKKDWRREKLVSSTKNSWQMKDPPAGGLFPQNISQPEKKELKEFTLIGQIENKRGTKIVVIPSSRFILEKYLTRTSSNLEFILNLLNDLASGGALSGIRERIVVFYPLPDLPEREKDLFKYLNVFLFPGIFGLFGAIKLLKKT